MTATPQIILMRGLPSCGKSWSARKLAEAGGGELLAFDAYFDEHEETRDLDALARRCSPEARRWHLDRVRSAVDAVCPLIVVDDDHRPGSSAKAIVGYAVTRGYEVLLAEPQSPWWQEIRPLLADKETHGEALARWATKLSLLSRSGHAATPELLLRRMDAWQAGVTPADLLTWGEEPLEAHGTDDVEVAA